MDRARRRFTLTIAAVVLVTGVVAAFTAQVLAEREARRSAETRVIGMARGLAAPLLNDEVRSGDPEALEALGRVLRGRISGGGVDQIVLWSVDGTVLWSSREADIGRRFPLPNAAEEAFASMEGVVGLPGEAEAHAGPLGEAEDQIEVYAAAYDSGGEPFVLEAYLPSSTIGEARADVLPALLLLGVAPVLLLAFLVLPIARTLVGSVEQARRLQLAALDRSVGSWRHQRRLLAEELHDGVIQDLAAIHYGLAVLTSGAEPDRTADNVRARMRESIESAEASLRSLVFDLTPRTLADDGLRTAVTELAERYDGPGLTVRLTMESEARAPEGTSTLAFRAMREGLRNVVKHAGATQAWVRIAPTPDGGLEVSVEDDGAHPVKEGALRSGQGLRLLTDTVLDAGGAIRLRPRPEGIGTVLRVTIPPLHAEPGRPDTSE